MPQNEYKKVRGGSDSENSFMRILFAYPAIPNVETYPNAIIKDGMQRGIEAVESSSFLPQKFRFETKKAAVIPTTRLSKVDARDSSNVNAIIFKSPPRE